MPKKYLIKILIFNLISYLKCANFCCEHDFRIEREYCEPLASVFQFQVLDFRKLNNLIEYNVEVTKTYRGHFQVHTVSVLQIYKHYCFPEIRIYPGQKYLSITKSIRSSRFTIDPCFFDLIQFAYPKVRDNQLLCLPPDINSSLINDKISNYCLFCIIFAHIMFILFWN